MELFINSGDKQYLEVALWDKQNFLIKKQVFAKGCQAEVLLPIIENLLNKSRIKLDQIQKIKVASTGGSFTSLRIGVVTANAIAYALNIGINNLLSNNSQKIKNKLKLKLNIIQPQYNSQPNIKIKKSMI